MIDQERFENHRHSIRNQREILASSRCGCFYCLKTYSPKEIQSWVTEFDIDTALCPHCGIDAVLGDASGLTITREFLHSMHLFWFREP